MLCKGHTGVKCCRRRAARVCVSAKRLGISCVSKRQKPADVMHFYRFTSTFVTPAAVPHQPTIAQTIFFFLKEPLVFSPFRASHTTHTTPIARPYYHPPIRFTPPLIDPVHCHCRETSYFLDTSSHITRRHNHEDSHARGGAGTLQVSLPAAFPRAQPRQNCGADYESPC